MRLSGKLWRMSKGNCLIRGNLFLATYLLEDWNWVFQLRKLLSNLLGLHGNVTGQWTFFTVIMNSRNAHHRLCLINGSTWPVSQSEGIVQINIHVWKLHHPVVFKPRRPRIFHGISANWCIIFLGKEWRHFYSNLLATIRCNLKNYLPWRKEV